MKRSELNDVLGRVAPALSGKDLLPILSCFCFDGETVTAYDDVVALQAPLKFPVEGAIRGKLLLDHLAASRSAEVEIDQSGGEVVVKAGRSKLTAPILPKDDFLFHFPEPGKGAVDFGVPGSFVDALRKAMISMGLDPAHPWRLGVTVVIADGKITLYSSDNKRVTRVITKAPKGAPTEETVVVLTPRFCSLLVDVGGKDKPKRLNLSSNGAIVEFESGLRLFSKTIGESNVDSFRQMVKGLKKEGKQALVEIPKGLDRCLDRALVVLPYMKDPHTTLKIDGDGKMTMRTNSQAGNVRETVTVEGHGEAEGDCDPRLFREALDCTVQFRLVEGKVLHFEGEGIVHIVSLIHGAGESEEETKDNE